MQPTLVEKLYSPAEEIYETAMFFFRYENPVLGYYRISQEK
jgi:hypothetical protein